MSACKRNPKVHCMCDDGSNCNQKSEALRLADELEAWCKPGRWTKPRYAAAELRRLHDEVQMLRDQNTELDKRLAELSERHLTDEVIADLWHQSGGFNHHFAHAIERWLRGEK